MPSSSCLFSLSNANTYRLCIHCTARLSRHDRLKFKEQMDTIALYYDDTSFESIKFNEILLADCIYLL